MHIHIYIYIHNYMYIHIHLCICIYIYIYIYIMYPTAWAVSIIFKETALGIFAIYRGLSMTPIHMPRFLSDGN